MKILLCADLGKGIPYVDDLHDLLRERGVDLTVGVKHFWNSTETFDVLMLQWHEDLFDWKTPGKNDLKRLKERLDYWQGRTQLVLTRHNVMSKSSKDHNARRMYRLVNSYLSGVVHFGEYSRKDYLFRYNSFAREQIHQVIPHTCYESLPNEIGREEARRKLNIAPDKKVILVYGSLRYESARMFAIQVFNKLDDERKFLLVPQWNTEEVIQNSVGPLGKLIDKVKLAVSRAQSSHVMLKAKNMYREDVQLYMNAADVVFVPQVNEKNACALSLGFTFRKVVVAPESGNFTEWQKDSHNPHFAPGDVEGASRAIKEALFSAEHHKGEQNYDYMHKYRNYELVSNLYSNFLNKVMGKSLEREYSS